MNQRFGLGAAVQERERFGAASLKFEVSSAGGVDAESLERTFAEGRMVYWSRSRQELWRKGDTSGDRQWVRQAFYDCDGDTLLFLVEQEGAGACHTGAPTCFFRAFGAAE